MRVEAVKQLTGARALDALIQATHDNDPEVQIRATDGLVNFYLPGYVQTGFGASIKRVGGSIKGRFTDTNDQVVDPFVTARPDVIAAHRRTGTRRRQHGGPRQRRARGRESCAARPPCPTCRGAAHQGHGRALRIADRACRRSATNRRAPDRLPAARSESQGADRGHRNYGAVAQPGGGART